MKPSRASETITTLCFDGAGTLTKPQYTHNKIPLLFAAKYGCTPEKFLDAWAHWEPSQETGEITNAECWQGVFQELGLAPDIDGAAALFIQTIEEMPGAMALVRAAHGRYRTVLADNECAEYERFREERLHFLRHFDVQCSSYLCGFLKPDPGFYRELLKKARVRPEECVFIDDKERNAAPARAIGMHTIVFVDAEQTARELRKLGVHV